MVAQSEMQSRIGLARELADIAARQECLVEAGQLLCKMASDEELRQQFQNILDEDIKNLSLLNTGITQFGVREQPKEVTCKQIQLASEVINGEYTFLEKFSQYATLKNQQVACGHLAHKIVQVAPLDVKEALAPLYVVNADNTRHEKALVDILEKVGTRELTGREPQQGVWAGIKDTIAHVGGAMAGRVAKPAEEMSITTLLTMDHKKATTLFKEIQAEEDAPRRMDLFMQLYADLQAHSQAEQIAFYQPVSKIEGVGNIVNHFYTEHAGIKDLLSEIRDLPPRSEQFLAKLGELQLLVDQHVDEEENVVFPKVTSQLDEEVLQNMAAEFMQNKERIQNELAYEDQDSLARERSQWQEQPSI